jgi:hypothetical protein
MNRSLTVHHRVHNPKEPSTESPAVTDESLVIRNYNHEGVEITVQFLNPDDDVAFDRTYALGPGDVASTPTRLQRGVYRVVARLDDGPLGTEGRDTADCLVGSDPTETAVVESGNGVVSVTEGLV